MRAVVEYFALADPTFLPLAKGGQEGFVSCEINLYKRPGFGINSAA